MIKCGSTYVQQLTEECTCFLEITFSVVPRTNLCIKDRWEIGPSKSFDTNILFQCAVVLDLMQHGGSRPSPKIFKLPPEQQIIYTLKNIGIVFLC